MYVLHGCMSIVQYGCRPVIYYVNICLSCMPKKDACTLYIDDCPMAPTWVLSYKDACPAEMPVLYTVLNNILAQHGYLSKTDICPKMMSYACMSYLDAFQQKCLPYADAFPS